MAFGTRLCEIFTLLVNVLAKIIGKKDKLLWCAKSSKGHLVGSTLLLN